MALVLVLVLYILPPTPSAEGDGSDTSPLVLVSPEPNGKPRPVTRLKAHDSTLERVAQSIHARHPSAHGRRDCSIAMVEKKLEAILKHKHTPEMQRETYLVQLERNHAGMCASEEWRKEDGQFAKGLRNYLAPTEERYDIEAVQAPKSEPARLMA